MNIIEIRSDLYLIPLDQKLQGFKSFISAWLYKGKKNFLIDVGPASTVPVLVKALEELNVKQLDAIFLTHIHIDHAGGTGELVSQFPVTRIVCHGSGIPHLKDPSRLWEGSLKTLGDTALAYGQIKPVPSDLLHDVSKPFDFGKPEVIPYLTPGHAPHHVSYKIGNCLFAGEAGGVFLDFSIGSGLRSDVGSSLRFEPTRWYLRPATPPKFFMETSIRSLETLIKIPHKLLCYGHFGASTDTPVLLEVHKRQLFFWKNIIKEQIQLYSGADLLEPCLNLLLEKDPLLAGLKYFESDVQKRERGFLYNSIRGFAGYLNNK